MANTNNNDGNENTNDRRENGSGNTEQCPFPMSDLERELWGEMTRKEKLEWIKNEKDRQERRQEREAKERIELARARNEFEDDDLERHARRVRVSAPRMPNEAADVPGWLNAMENIFEMQKVPKIHWGPLIIPFLNEKAKGVLMRITSGQMTYYEELRQELLTEFRLAPATYLANFKGCVKGERETWMQFASRLDDLLTYYWASKGVDSLDRARELCVADQLKSKLNDDAREYVVLQEGGETKTALQLADFVENYEEAKGHNSGGKTQRHRIDNGSWAGAPSTGPKSADRTWVKPKPEYVSSRSNVTCWNCGKSGHTRPECKERKGDYYEIKNERKVNRVETEAVTESDEGKRKLEQQEKANVRSAHVNHQWGERAKNLTLRSEEVELIIEGTASNAIIDSGTQMSVVKAELVDSFKERSEGKIKLVGAFGHQVEAELVTVKMGLDKGAEVRVVCAVTDKLTGNTNCLINPHDLDSLKEAREEREQENGRTRYNSVQFETKGKERESPTDEWLVAQIETSDEGMELSRTNTDCFKWNRHLTKRWRMPGDKLD